MTEKKKYHLPLIALLAVAIGTYDMVTSSSLVLFCVGLGAAFSCMGMFEPKYHRATKYLAILSIASACVAQYLAGHNQLVLIVIVALFAAMIIEYMRENRKSAA